MKLAKLILIAGLIPQFSLAGDDVTKQYTVENLKALEQAHSLVFASAGEVRVKQGAGKKISIAADAEVLNNIIVEVRDGTVWVEVKKPGLNLSQPKPINVDVELPDYHSVSLRGAGHALIGDITTKNLRLAVDGSGHMTAGVLISEAINLSLVGSGKLKVGSVKAVNTDVVASGSGECLFNNITSDTHNFSLNGSGNVTTEALTGKQLAVKQRGSGILAINGGGEIDSQNIQLDGSGGYQAAQLVSREAVVNLKGNGHADINVAAKLDVTIDGSGHVGYKGEPGVLKSQVKGAGSLNKL